MNTKPFYSVYNSAMRDINFSILVNNTTLQNIYYWKTNPKKIRRFAGLQVVDFSNFRPSLDKLYNKVEDFNTIEEFKLWFTEQYFEYLV